MNNSKIIRKLPLFEIYLENNNLIINNLDYIKDNCVLNLKELKNVELIRSFSFFEKMIEVLFGFWGKSKSDILRINFNEHYKDIILSECDIMKTEAVIYEINDIISKQVNEKNIY